MFSTVWIQYIPRTGLLSGIQQQQGDMEMLEADMLYGSASLNTISCLLHNSTVHLCNLIVSESVKLIEVLYISIEHSFTFYFTL